MTSWMIMEDTMLSEIIQTQRGQYYISYVWIPKRSMFCFVLPENRWGGGWEDTKKKKDIKLKLKKNFRRSTVHYNKYS